MNIKRPEDKFDVSLKNLGIAMGSFMGGRSETRIRLQEVPVVPVDFTSEYPSTCVLLGIWNILTAQRRSLRMRLGKFGKCCGDSHSTTVSSLNCGPISVSSHSSNLRSASSGTNVSTEALQISGIITNLLETNLICRARPDCLCDSDWQCARGDSCYPHRATRQAAGNAAGEPAWNG